MPAYLDKAGFKLLTVMPAVYVDAIDASTAGWVDKQLELASAWVDAKLRKRYAVPFASPYPMTVTGWVEALVTMRAYLKRGVDATDEQYQQIAAAAETAKAEVTEAANADTGLFDLPLRADTAASGVAKGGPRSYTEQSPYAWTDRQARAGHAEDAAGEGSYD
jgi:hypothetical protein